MSGLKDVVKGGWHPKGKDGKGESWRGEHKGINQVAGLVGMGKDTTSRNVDGHVSQPLSTLKDPASFGPPPRRVSGSDGITSASTGASKSKPPTWSRTEQRMEEEVDGNGPAPAPDRPPLPPARRYATDSGGGGTNVSSEPPKPNLPPRLPPRLNSNPSAGVSSPLPAYDITTRNPARDNTSLNQGALNRLGQAGVSVPGFNIGRRTSSQEASGSPVQSPSPNSSSGVLQSGFSKLPASSPKPDPPREGTTFAQKQAALRTAESFRKDPSSVSLADARSAASTANNFRERHGEQVARGWKAADSLNKKYAIVDRANSYAGNQPSSAAPDLPPNKPSSATESPSSPATPETSIATGKKKPPPPPPPRKRELGGKGDQGGVAPPLPIASKPKPGYTASPHSDQDRPIQIAFKGATDTPGDVDLDLGSLWFAKTPVAFPPPAIARVEEKIYSLSHTWSQSGSRTTHTLTAAIRWTSNLSTTQIRLTWDSSNPELTVKSEQKHLPPPTPLSPRELTAQHHRYGDRIARWCESRMETQVGNGYCWTLAHDALEAVAKESKARGEESVMVSSGTIHGCCIYAHYMPSIPSLLGGSEAVGIGRGDILQFKSSHFVHRDPKNPLNKWESWAGGRKGTSEIPDHTAVVVGVDGRVLRVLEQNVGGVMKVREGTYQLDEMVDGEVRAFRAVGESWCPFETSW